MWLLWIGVGVLLTLTTLFIIGYLMQYGPHHPTHKLHISQVGL